MSFGGFTRRDGGILGSDAVRLDSDDNRPVGAVFDVGDQDLTVVQSSGATSPRTALDPLGAQLFE